MADKNIKIHIGSGFVGTGFAKAKAALTTLGRNLVNVQAGISLATSAYEKFTSIFSKSFRFETQTTQFKTLIGDIDEAKAHMADLKALGDTPPFSLDQFAAASRSLMVMTDGALGYKKSLEMIGDAAAATGHPIEQMGHAVGRLYAYVRDGQPISRAVMELRNMGVITPEVAARLQDMQATGKSGVEIWGEVENALKRYSGAMKETEGTGEGLMGAIKSRWDNIVRAFGNAMAHSAKNGMGRFLDAAKRLEKSGTLEVWAAKVGRACDSIIPVLKTVAEWGGKIADAFHWVQDKSAQVGAYAGGFVGALSAGGSFKESAELARQSWERTGRLRADERKEREEEDRRIRKEERERIAAEDARKEVEDAARAAEEEERKLAALKEGDRKRAAEAEAKAEMEAAKKAAQERERLDRELHQKRIADLREEIAAQKEAATPLQAVAAQAKTEFERAFAMYRSPERAKAEIDEEKDRAEDLKRLHKDASRYGGKWRIDELSALMSAGDTAGVQSRLEEWRKSRSFTPEVEAMVRASAAEKTQTTVEDELRKIETNTSGLAQKLDELLSMKG